jgi:hypothetical protein
LQRLDRSLEDSFVMSEIAELLAKYKGKRASVNPRESEFYGWLVVDVEPLKPPDKSISIIEQVTPDFLVLNYYDSKEMHYLPLDKIIKVNIISRDR